MYYKSLTTAIILTSILIGIGSCASDKLSPETLSDTELIALTKDTLNKTYYQNAATLGAAGNSPHGSFKLHFNSTARNVLDASLELPSGAEFPDGSLLAKEVYDGSTLDLYAIMYKYKGVWLWAEYSANSDVIYSVNLRGGQCISCHSINPQRDLVRTFDLH